MLYPFNLSFSLSLLFMGFLFANFFGIITSTKNVIFIFIMFIELINYFVYTQIFCFRFQKSKNLPSKSTLLPLPLRLYPFGVRKSKIRRTCTPVTPLPHYPCLLRKPLPLYPEEGIAYGERGELPLVIRWIAFGKRKGYRGDFIFDFLRIAFGSFLDRFWRKKERKQPETIQKGLDETENKKALTKNYLSSNSPLATERNAKVFDYVFTYILTILNFLKIGFEFGFFVDAFKLGS